MHGFGFQKLIQQNQFYVKSQNAVLNICHLTTFFFQFPGFGEETKETNFSVKSSWEVN